MTGKFPDLFRNCVLWWPGLHCASYAGDYDEFPIIPAGVAVTNNGTWTKDDLGNNQSVMKFNGSTNSISLTDTDAWNFGSGGFTICAWVRSTQLNANFHITWQDPGSPYWYLYIDNANKLQFLTTQSWVSSNAAILASINTWYHIAYVQTGAISAIMCVNGVSVAATTSSMGASPDVAAPLMIGATFDSGNIKDLFIYKGRALTFPELKLLMNKTHPVTGTGLIPGPYDYYKVV